MGGFLSRLHLVVHELSVRYGLKQFFILGFWSEGGGCMGWFRLGGRNFKSDTGQGFYPNGESFGAFLSWISGMGINFSCDFKLLLHWILKCYDAGRLKYRMDIERGRKKD